MRNSILLAASAALFASPVFAQDAEPEGAPSPNQIVDAAPDSEWVTIPAENLIVMTLAPNTNGDPRQVIIQLMPAPFSQGWVNNIRTFARAGWYDGITVNRVQDNYVVQWGDPNYDNPEGEGAAKPLPEGLTETSGEDYVRKGPGWAETHLLPPGLPRDPYAASTFFIEGFPFGSDQTAEQVWPIHCYGMIGVGRGYSPDAGSGAELYTVIGHAPRHLDKNIALVGRIVEGMENLSSLPRGSGTLGFYTADEAQLRTPIQSVRVASDLPAKARPAFQYLSSASQTFTQYAEARANRRDPFFIAPAGGADICNIPVPVRRAPNG